MVFPEQLKALSLEALDARMENTPKAMQLNLGNFSFIYSTIILSQLDKS